MTKTLTVKKIDATLATNIRARRLQLGISQLTVAKWLGLHRPAVSEIEANRRQVTANELVLLSHLLETTVESLLGIDD